MRSRPLQQALIAAGATGIRRSYFYADYLFDLAKRKGGDPISEEQWDILVHLLDYRKLESQDQLDLIFERLRDGDYKEAPEDDLQDAANIVDTHLPAIAGDFAKQGFHGAASTIRRTRELMMEMMERERERGS